MATPDYYPITGIQEGFGDKGQVPQRLEIDTWWNSSDPTHVDQVSLFTAALKQFQAIPHTKRESYFRIAGIHSEPLYLWDEEGPQNKRQANEYCQHGVNLFPTWHRPYVLLFEQRLHEIMVQEIIPLFPKDQQTSLKRAANSWRMPYWDWASKKPVLDTVPEQYDYDVPQLLRLETIKIRTPAGLKWVKNPLYVFRMAPDTTLGDGGVNGVGQGNDSRGKPLPLIPFDRCVATSRYPPTNALTSSIAKTFIDGFTDNDSVMRRLRDYKIPDDADSQKASPDAVVGGNVSASLREAFYRVLRLPVYEDFSSTRRPGNKSDFTLWHSIEGIHNNLHVWCGGGAMREPGQGNMTFPEVAAFDPIFWLHHCNVDRLFALWQALHPWDAAHPQHWFASEARNQQKLRPFHRNKAGDYWTSDKIYETAKLGYTYPELPKSLSQSKGAEPKVTLNFTPEQLNKELNASYNSTRRAEQKASITTERTADVLITQALKVGPATKIQTALVENPALVVKQGEISDQLGVYDYLVDVKFALDGKPFIIYIFIGNVPDKDAPSDAVEYKNAVGQIYNFVAPIRSIGVDDEAGCANCKTQAKEKAELAGQVVLTNALITRWKQRLVHENNQDENQVLQSMNPEDVAPFLKTNLHWRIAGIDGSVILNEDMPSLKVAVAVGQADHFADDTKLSEYYGYKILYEVTDGRVAGASPADHLFAPGLAFDGEQQ
ncbi:MAG: hypothetical protein M4579_006330 [Chaenotheca gracillima]|nr:MAG: hypothetical protein M4579_006330 [Chaenotheca gracillima]